MSMESTAVGLPSTVLASSSQTSPIDATRASHAGAGACAAAGVDVDLNLRTVARTHGQELAARVRADLRHPAPDLSRRHLPRIAPDGLLRPGPTIALARYDAAGPDGAGPVHLVARTPPAWADAGQRISLALWDGSQSEAAARRHPHAVPAPDRTPLGSGPTWRRRCSPRTPSSRGGYRRWPSTGTGAATSRRGSWTGRQRWAGGGVPLAAPVARVAGSGGPFGGLRPRRGRGLHLRPTGAGLGRGVRRGPAEPATQAASDGHRCRPAGPFGRSGWAGRATGSVTALSDCRRRSRRGGHPRRRTSSGRRCTRSTGTRSSRTRTGSNCRCHQ